MALLDVGTIYNSADSSDIFVRFQGACLVAAKDIKAESESTENHAARLDWANAMFSGDRNTVVQRVRRILRYSIATNSTFQTSGTAVTDNDVGFMVATALAIPSNL